MTLPPLYKYLSVEGAKLRAAAILIRCAGPVHAAPIDRLRRRKWPPAFANAASAQ
jgi:hypothetical protein